MMFVLLFLVPFTQNYINFSNSSGAEELLYKFVSDRVPIPVKWDRYVGSDFIKGWYLREVTNAPVIDSLLLEKLKYQVYPRHPIIALEFKKSSASGLGVARRFDPFSPDVPFYRIITLLADRNLKGLNSVINDLKSYFGDFYFQLFTVGNLILCLYLTIFLAGIAFFLILFFRYLPVYIQNLGMILPVPDFFRFIVAAIIIFPLVFLTRNLIIIALISSIPLYLYASRNERRWVRFFLIWILLSIPISYVTHSIVMTLRGENEAGIIYRSLKIGYDPKIEHLRDPGAVFTNAYVSNLNGEWQKAESLYQYLLKADRNDFMYLNNLGNIRFQLGDQPSAESLYLQSTRKAEKSGVPFQNLGNLYLKQLRFLESSRSFKIARDRGAPQVNRIIDFRPVESNLWPKIFKLDLRFPQLFTPYILIIAIIIYLFGRIFTPISTANFCSLCGAPITKETAISDNQVSYCRGCGIKLQTARDDKTKERILKQIMDRSIVWDRIRGIIFTIILPGFGQIYFGRIFKGIIISLLPLFAYLLLYLSRPPLITPFWHIPPITAQLIMVSLPMIILFFIIALIGVLGYGARRKS